VKKDINIVPASPIKYFPLNSFSFELKNNLFGCSSNFSSFLGRKTL